MTLEQIILKAGPKGIFQYVQDIVSEHIDEDTREVDDDLIDEVSDFLKRLEEDTGIPTKGLEVEAYDYLEHYAEKWADYDENDE